MLSSPDDKPAGLSYAGVYARGAREAVIEALGALGFSGYVGPQEGAWVVAVAANPRGAVASGKRRVDDVARESAATLGAVVLAVEVDRDERLRLWPFEEADALPAYDSAPPQEDGEPAYTLDDFGNPVLPDGAPADGEMVAAALLATLEVADEDDALVHLLDEELGEDTSESERLVAVLRLLGLPTWIVSSDSLPKRVPGGPDKDEVIRLGAGKTGLSGRVADALRRPVRQRPKRER